MEKYTVAEIKDAALAASQAGYWDTAAELLERYRTEILGRYWCTAERLDWDSLAPALQNGIRKRVTGPATACPGDLAVQALRTVEDLRALDDVPRGLAADMLGGAVEPCHFYDSFLYGASPAFGRGSIRLFSSANVGWRDRCNLQVAGQLSYQHSILLTGWEITVRPTISTLIHGVFTLSIKHRVVAETPAQCLQMRLQKLLRILPTRQIIDVRFASPDAETADEVDLRPPDGTRVFVHLRGWRPMR